MRTTVFLVILAAGAFAVRIAFTVAFRGGLDTVPAQEIAGADGVEYDLLARHVATGKGYSYDGVTPTAFRAPGLPLFVAVLYSVFGIYYPAAYISFALWGAAGAIGAYLFADEVLGVRPARWVGVFAALYPPDIYNCSYFFSELLFAPLLAFGLWLLARSVRTSSLSAAAGAGLFLGYATLTRSFGVLFLPIFALYLAVIQPRGWRAAVAFGIAFIAVLAPWSIRNYLAFGRPVLIATNGGSTFYGANNDIVAGTPREFGNWVSTKRLPGRDEIDAQPDEISHDKKEWQLGIDWVKHHPEKFVLIAPAKIVRFWFPFVGFSSFKRYPIVNIGLMAPLLLLILLGIGRSLLKREGRSVLILAHLTLLANLVMVVSFWGGERFRDANVPVLVLYGVVGLWWLRYRTDVFSSSPVPGPHTDQTRVASGPTVC